MMTILVTVDNKKNAQLFTKMLRSMVFVKNIEEDSIVSQQTDQFAMLNDILNTINPNSVFNSISDPIVWQKKIRDKWGTR